MSLTVFLLIAGAVLSLPGGLFVAFFLSAPRARFAAIVGGILGAAVVGLGVWYFVRASHVYIDALSYWFGVFFACSIGVFIGALVMNFLVNLGSRTPDISSAEY